MANHAYDGNLYSGGATSSGAASRSAMRTVTYAAVPSVTVSAPDIPGDHVIGDRVLDKHRTRRITASWSLTILAQRRSVRAPSPVPYQSVVIPVATIATAHDYSLVVAVTDHDVDR